MNEVRGHQIEPPNIMAWVALACSLGLCPIVSLAGVLLGFRSLVVINARGLRRGRRIAMAAIALGVFVLGAWIAVAVMAHVTIRAPIINGPRYELEAAFDGDVAQMIEGFGMEQTPASEQIIEDFIAVLRSRYGGFVDMSQQEFAESTQLVQDGQRFFPSVFVIPYDIQFEQANVRAIGHFARERGLMYRWKALIVRDAVLDDLYFPSEAAAELDDASAEAIHGQ